MKSSTLYLIRTRDGGLAIMNDLECTNDVTCFIYFYKIGEPPLVCQSPYQDDQKEIYSFLYEIYCATTTFRRAPVNSTVAQLRHTGQPMSE